jgi:hypothetical protein
MILCKMVYTRWFKYDRDYLCVNKSQFFPVIFEPPCILKHKAKSYITFEITILQIQYNYMPNMKIKYCADTKKSE